MPGAVHYVCRMCKQRHVQRVHGGFIPRNTCDSCLSAIERAARAAFPIPPTRFDRDDVV